MSDIRSTRPLGLVSAKFTVSAKSQGTRYLLLLLISVFLAQLRLDGDT